MPLKKGQLTQLLILDEQAGQTGLLEAADGAEGVGGVAVAALGVGDDGDVHRVHDVAAGLQHLIIGQNAGIGHTQLGAVNAEAGGGDQIKTGGLNAAGGQGVERAGRHNNAVLGHQFSQTFLGIHFENLQISFFGVSAYKDQPLDCSSSRSSSGSAAVW